MVLTQTKPTDWITVIKVMAIACTPGEGEGGEEEGGERERERERGRERGGGGVRREERKIHS